MTDTTPDTAPPPAEPAPDPAPEPEQAPTPGEPDQTPDEHPSQQEAPADDQPTATPAETLTADGIFIDGDPDDPKTRGYVATPEVTIDGQPAVQTGTKSGPAAGPSPDAGGTTVEQ